MSQRKNSCRLAAVLVGLATAFSLPAFAQTNWQNEWMQRTETAKKDGKVVFSIPPSTELRRALESSVRKKLGFEIEVVPGTAAKIIRRIADEYQAGVRYFDVIISTFDNLEHSLIPMGAIEPLESNWILPEVRREKLVGRSHLDRQLQTLRLLSICIHAGQYLVQQRSGQTGGNPRL